MVWFFHLFTLRLEMLLWLGAYDMQLQTIILRNTGCGKGKTRKQHESTVRKKTRQCNLEGLVSSKPLWKWGLTTVFIVSTEIWFMTPVPLQHKKCHNDAISVAHDGHDRLGTNKSKGVATVSQQDAGCVGRKNDWNRQVIA